jgi:hypothetical protein
VAGFDLTISKVKALSLLHDPGTWCGQRRHEEEAEAQAFR